VSRKPSVLIVSAFAPELAPLARWLAGPSGRRFKTIVHAVPVGIGAIDAGVGAAAAIAQITPDVVLFVGTGGSYGRRPAIGDVAIAARIRLVSTAALRAQGYLPKPMHVLDATDAPLRRELLLSAGGRGCVTDVATPLSITTAPPLVELVAGKTRADVENLEVFGVARAVSRARLPFGALLGITNRVGPQAHREWVAHQAQATAAACAVAASWLEGRFAGVRPARRTRRAQGAQSKT